jgi:predicted Zn-dependent protease
VGELLAKAELEHSAGQLPQAEATLERAIRIAPRDPLLWQRLAEIRLDQGDAQQAEALARKSNALVTLDTSLMHRNWQIIAQARRMRDDEEGAQDAERRARHLGSQ